MKLFSIFRAPSIIVIDDIDSMFANRDKTQNEALRRLVSTLLTLMDGIVSVGLVEQKKISLLPFLLHLSQLVSVYKMPHITYYLLLFYKNKILVQWSYPLILFSI